MDFRIVVIGAGVVGLAIAAELSKTFSDIVVLEKNLKFGQETSSRNSEVIHSGIYYPQNSLKAKFCVEGRKLLYDYCIKNEISYKKCGKYVVATNEKENEKLDDILIRAKKNGVENAKRISLDEFKKAEPNVKACGALHFAESGIIDTFALMKSLETHSVNNNVQIVYNSEVVGVKKINNAYQITVKESDSIFNFSTEIVINASGLGAFNVSSMIGLAKPEYELFFWKGEYFSVGNGKNKFVKSLIYPVPNDEISLGIHATIDINGRLKLGPNAILTNAIDYSVDKKNKKDFYESAKRFLPFLEPEDLESDQAGIRPKLTKNRKEFRDFILKNEKDNGFENFINLIGIESPGITASLSIAEYVKNLII